MKTVEETKKEFWTDKLYQYAGMFELRNDNCITNPDEDMQFIADELAKKYGAENVRVKKEQPYSRSKKKQRLDWRISLNIQKNNNPNVVTYLSNWTVSLSCPNDFFIGINDSYSKWCHSNCYHNILALFDCIYEHYEADCDELQKRIVECEKENKIIEMSQTSIKTFVLSILSQTNYQWNLVEEKERMVLQIKMKRGKMMEITLGYKTFTHKIDDMMTVITQIEQLLATIPYPVNIRSYGNNIDWRGGGK